MTEDKSKDLWLGCFLGYRIAWMLAGKDAPHFSRLINTLKDIADGETALNDPGQNASQFSTDKEIFQMIANEVNRSDRELAKKALQQLASGNDG